MQRWARRVGALLIVLSLGFVAERLWSSELWRSEPQQIGRLALPLLVASVVYMLSGLILARSWWRLVTPLGHHAFSWPQAVALHGRSQLAKYIPGNVFHLLGRHAQGRAEGLGHQAQLLALFFEIALSVLAAATLALPVPMVVSTATPHTPLLFGIWLLLAVTVALMLPRTTKLLLPRLAWLHRFAPERLVSGEFIRATRGAYLYDISFFLVSSLIVATLVMAIAPASATLAPLIAITATAWLVGFITPGASAGIGVREATFILLLTPLLGSGNATLIALSYRLVTTAGDLGYFLLSLLFRRTLPPPAAVGYDG